jgi:gas vesicle protein
MTNDEQEHGFLAGLVLGAVAGGAAALLMSPKSGREMRALIKEVVQEWQGEASEAAGVTKEVLEAFEQALNEGAADVARRVPRQSQDVVDQAGRVFETAHDRVGAQYEQARHSVQEMVDSWKQGHQAPAWPQHETPHHEAATKMEPSVDSSWSQYQGSNPENYRFYKGGSVSSDTAVAEHEVASEPLVRPEFGRPHEDEVVEEQPFLAPPPEEFARLSSRTRDQSPVAPEVPDFAAEAADRPVEKPMVDELSKPRLRRTRSVHPEPELSEADSAKVAGKPAKKFFFKKK